MMSPEPSRIIINNWVSDQTESRIKDLIPPDRITIDTRLVLTNAVYFRANWDNFFERTSTRDGQFNLPDGSALTVPMMNRTASFGYVAGDGYQAVELPYSGRELSMVV